MTVHNKLEEASLTIVLEIQFTPCSLKSRQFHILRKAP
jgi:hypothetical protein